MYFECKRWSRTSAFGNEPVDNGFSEAGFQRRMHGIEIGSLIPANHGLQENETLSLLQKLSPECKENPVSTW